MEKQKIYKAKNKDKIKAYQDQWRKDNPIDKEKKRLINKKMYERTNIKNNIIKIIKENSSLNNNQFEMTLFDINEIANKIIKIIL